MYGGPDHAVCGVPAGADRLVERGPETRPAGATVELGCRGEQIQVAANTSEIAATLFVQEWARKGTFGRALPKHRILVRREPPLPVGVGPGHLECFGGHRSA